MHTLRIRNVQSVMLGDKEIKVEKCALGLEIIKKDVGMHGTKLTT